MQKVLRENENGGKIVKVKDKHPICPNCKRNKLPIQIYGDTVVHGLQVFCRHCKAEIKLDIDEGQCFWSQC